MISTIETSNVFGISVRGPAHVKAKQANQDAWFGCKNRSFAMAVVCDGLGSRPYANEGARFACRAAYDAIRIFSKVPDANPSFIPKLIKQIWEMRLGNRKYEDYATTCLVMCLMPSRRMVIAGLGDGIALLKMHNEDILEILQRNTEFVDRTVALGTHHQLSDWVLFEKQIQPGTTAFIATDGIADDLRSEKYAELLTWMVRKFGRLDPHERTRQLRYALNNWATPRHQDDKSLAIMYIPRTKLKKSGQSNGRDFSHQS